MAKEPQWRADEVESIGLALVVWILFFLLLAGVPLLIPVLSCANQPSCSSPQFVPIDLWSIVYTVAGAVIIQWISYSGQKRWATFTKYIILALYVASALVAISIIGMAWHQPAPQDLRPTLVAWGWDALIGAAVVSIASTVLFGLARR